ncbi:hypothetical protein CC2G_000172 [Coprinopsis cinerea AmutBmut pab1-1]|nr:hypothetical protein CC2G_000172 [Coprinopsis cinerea AmutBmut pab1-1]KAG2022424.1 hypothetical protein CC2G_000172 [Coprinopsis cinerea AmutBmut pab1-1]
MLPRIYSAVSSRLPAALGISWFSSLSQQTNMASISELVDSTIEKNRVVIFSKSYCPYCRKAKNLFAEKFPQVEPKVLELDELDNGSAIQDYLHQKTGQRTVPNVFVESQHIGGSDDTKVALESGKLAKLLTAA